jgi:hypothetical protein
VTAMERTNREKSPRAGPAHFSRLNRHIRMFLLSLVSLCSALPSYAQQAKPDEYQIEATYLYDFTRFVAWPTQTSTQNQPFGICVLGTDPFGRELDAVLAGGHVGNRSLVAKRISKPQQTSECQILFVSASEEGRLNEILTALDRSSVLTVSDIPQFSQRGGMIQFVLDGGKVRFEVNLSKAGDAGLTLSSDLLRVALAVRRHSQPGQ